MYKKNFLVTIKINEMDKIMDIKNASKNKFNV